MSKHQIGRSVQQAVSGAASNLKRSEEQKEGRMLGRIASAVAYVVASPLMAAKAVLKGEFKAFKEEMQAKDNPKVEAKTVPLGERTAAQVKREEVHQSPMNAGKAAAKDKFSIDKLNTIDSRIEHTMSNEHYVDLLAKAPVAKKEVSDHIRVLEGVMSKIEVHREDLLILSGDMNEDVANYAEVLLTKLDNIEAKRHQLVDFKENNPISLKSYHAFFNEFKAATYNAARDIVDEQNPYEDSIDMIGSHRFKASVDSKHAQMQDALEPVMNPFPLSDDRIAQSRDEMHAKAKEHMEGAVNIIAEKTGKKPSEVRKQIKDSMRDRLSDKEIRTIEKQIFVRDNSGYIQKLTSKMVPANEYLADTVGGPYKEGKGITSAMTSSKHVVNAFKSTLEDDAGNTIYECYRHGTITAFGIEDDDERKLANDNRAQELVAMIVESSPELRDEALESRSVSFPLVSVNLETAAVLGALMEKKSGAKVNEAKHVFEQIKALEGVRHVKIAGKNKGDPPIDIKVDLDFMGFNFGVNAGATGILAKAIGTWNKKVEAQNDKAMLALLGDWKAVAEGSHPGGIAGNRLISLKNEREVASDERKLEIDRDMKAIRTLALQISKLYVSRAYHKHGEEPYKIATRVAVLAQRSKGKACKNCKSGKDRTSLSDGEGKKMAAQINQGQDIPEPNAVMNRRETEFYKPFVYNSGNFEVQKFCTGGGGYKLKGVPGNFLRIGGVEAKGHRSVRDHLTGAPAVNMVERENVEIFHGQSDFASS